MQKEIFEQPAVIEDVLRRMINPVRATVHLPELPWRLSSLSKITIVACGT